MRSAGSKVVMVLSALLLVCSSSAFSQYFGRNKPVYRPFDFNVLQSPHFEIYHYLENDSLLKDFSEWAEEWYRFHQQIFRDTFEQKNPLILYSNHPDFQQTNAVSGSVGTGTGGVTESLKNRVVMPVAPTLSQTDHVLGHELVHAFQFKKILRADSSRQYSIQNIPLWMIEGMAEYLSIGSVDPNTAMWMRDALINDDFPTLKKLSTESKYFPYRYGHAFWATVGKTWGDTVLMPLFEQTAVLGLEKAIDTVLGYDMKTVSGMWKSAMANHFKKYMSDTAGQVIGSKLISEENGGRINISPSLSPDGKYLTFFSEKNLFTIDLFLADAETGRIIKKLTSIINNHEIDDFSFIESGGTWSPDSKKFAFVIFSEGVNKLAILDVDKARIIREVEMKGIPSFFNPAWSPDGKSIVFTGLVRGVSDLYLYHLDSGNTDRLTRDAYSNIHPCWSPDGRSIVFSAERLNSAENHKKYGFSLGLLDLRSGETEIIHVFEGADNLNPCFSNDGQRIYFLSNADGFRNLYRYDLRSKKVFRLTNYLTGISGITPYSPALSVAAESGTIAYTYYFNNSYRIYTAEDSLFQPVETDQAMVNFEAGTLPPLEHVSLNIVDSSLYHRTSRSVRVPEDSVMEVPYRPKFRLDAISNTGGVGITAGGYPNRSTQGAVSMIFSDIVGNNQLYSALSLNGEIYDFGGQAAYINQSRNLKWGASLSHIPYRFGEMHYRKDSINYLGEKILVNNLVLDYTRMFVDNVSLFAYYPLSRTRRLEGSASSSFYYFRVDRYNNYYDELGYNLGVTREKMDAPEGNHYHNLEIAYVTDNSFFGMTSPMLGGRSRYQLSKYFGMVDYYTILLDYRKYLYVKPFSLAFRIYHYGRYGKGSDSDVVSPIYMGYPWLIRGYENLSFYSTNTVQSGSINVSNLSGSRILVGNAELRLPVSGPERLALIGSKWFLVDLNLFFDGGVAWTRENVPELKWQASSFEDRIPVFSTGASIRINMLGALILEPYYAFPFQNGGFKNGMFGINITPGW
ncbi:MAG: hypothetical protein R6U78_00395 [Bacteroidales bacterium]